MKNLNMKVNIGGVELKNPVTTASGTFGSGREYLDFVDLSKLGAITVKGVSYHAWEGNNTPRVAEVYAGMLNSVGLQNPGVEAFIAEEIPFLRQFDTKIIVNVCGHSLEEYVNVVKRLQTEDIDLLELNISCPNITEGGMSFGTDESCIYNVVSTVKEYSKQPLIVKLSPNVTDISAMAKAAEKAGADAISLINTLAAMKIDIKTKKATLANKIGGLSGPAIKPIALRMVWQVANAVSIPIIGMGGICNFEDAIEFIMAGATSIAIGTANFINPYATFEVIEGIATYMKENSIYDLNEIIGIVK